MYILAYLWAIIAEAIFLSPFEHWNWLMSEFHIRAFMGLWINYKHFHEVFTALLIAKYEAIRATAAEVVNNAER